MNTSTRANELLQAALKSTREAAGVIDNLIANHDYQDVASLVTQAGVALLEAATLLMDSDGDAAIEQMERAEDLLDSVYAIIDGEIDEDEG
jgi:hypothetical protein